MEDTPLPPPTDAPPEPESPFIAVLSQMKWPEKEENQEERARENLEEEGRKTFIESVVDMMAIPVEHKANMQISVLTHGVMECMREASILLLNDEMQTDAGKAPDARRSVRHAEMQDMARLTEASARMLDAYTRFRRSNVQQMMLNHVTRKTMEDGSVHLTTLRHNTFPTTTTNDFAMSEEMLAAVRARSGEADKSAAAEPASAASAQS